MTTIHKTKVLIIGSGPAGYTAAIYAARANLKPILVAGYESGGQLMLTTDVENYPGFAKPIQGPWLMTEMREQVLALGTEIHNDYIASVDFSTRPFKTIGESGNTYIGETVIIATGAQARWLNLESETTFRGFGVSACATCDGFFFKNQEIAIVGGGNTAVEEAIYLTNFASKVTLIHRRNTLRAEKILQDRLFENPKISLLWNHTIEEFLGNETPKALKAVKVKNVNTNETTILNVSGVFIAIGHDPATKLFKGKIEIDHENYIVTKPDSTATNIPGIFAAGDVKDKIFRQAVTAAGMGCMAALEADKFLSHSSESTETNTKTYVNIQ